MILVRRLSASALLCLFGLAAGSAAAQSEQRPPDAEIGPVALRLGVNAFAAGWAMDGIWAGLAQNYGGGNTYKDHGHWGDLYLRPGVTAEAPSPIGKISSGLSASWGRTFGTDPYNYSDNGRAMLEDAWLGLATPASDPADPRLDLRAGRFSECFDGGFLLCQATVNGSERGLVMESPRTAWRVAGRARAELSGFSVTGAYLEPNNLASFDTNDAFAYLSAGYAAGGWELGGGYIRALQSTYAYPGALAPFALIPDGRDGLETWMGRAAFRTPLAKDTELAIRTIGGVQHQSRVDVSAWGGYAEAAIALRALPFAPKFSVGHARFSGDDPYTTKLERFDPLYYGGNGGLDGFFFGVIGPNLFLNTNLRITRANLDLVLSPQDFLKFQALNFEADQRNSPLQFGQAVRFDTSGTAVRFQRGVPMRSLGREILASWTHVLTAELALTANVSMFMPGDGLDALVGGHSRNWYAGGLQLSYRR